MAERGRGYAGKDPGRTGMASLRAGSLAAPWTTLLALHQAVLAWQTFLLAAPDDSQPTRNGWHVKGGQDGGRPSSRSIEDPRHEREQHPDGCGNLSGPVAPRTRRRNYTGYTTNLTGEERITDRETWDISFRRSRWQNREGIPDNA